MGELSKLPNISSVIESKLHAAGIYTQQDLKARGSKASFMRIRMIDGEACLSMLYALEGAIQGIRWHNLDKVTKTRLKEAFDSLSG